MGVVTRIGDALISAAKLIPYPQAQKWLFAYFHPVDFLHQEKGKAPINRMLFDLLLLSILSSLAGLPATLAYISGWNGAYANFVNLQKIAPLAALIKQPNYLILSCAISMLGPLALIFGSAFAMTKLGSKGKLLPQAYAVGMAYCAFLLMKIPLQLIGGISFWVFILTGIIMVVIEYYGYYVYFRILKECGGISLKRTVAALCVGVLLDLLIGSAAAVLLFKFF